MSTYVIRDIAVDLFDTKSIDKAIREIEYVQVKLLPAMRKMIESLIEKGVEIAKAELLAFEKPAFDTGKLHDSIEGLLLSDDTGAVATDVWYAVYVEYGTGEYASNGSGRKGGWTYYDMRTGRFRFTYGMHARPFMYNTLRSLERVAEDTGGRIVAEYLG